MGRDNTGLAKNGWTRAIFKEEHGQYIVSRMLDITDFLSWRYIVARRSLNSS